jgi:hypothetical protein
MAMACLRLFTLPPLPPFPLRSVPRFLLRIALATSLLALGLYLRLPDFFAAMLNPPSSKGVQSTCRRILEQTEADRLRECFVAGRSDPVTTPPFTTL